MRVGFTGTRRGMSVFQQDQFCEAISRLAPTEFHHGDCIGADAQAHELCLEAGIPVIIHPPVENKLRAFCVGATGVRPPQTYLERNRAIVRATEAMIAAPGGPEVRRSGTWSTVRYARSHGREVYILVWPDPEGGDSA